MKVKRKVVEDNYKARSTPLVRLPEEPEGCPPRLPDGDPAPADGSLPASALAPARGARRSASTCTCRSARCAAATATSTPTPADELGGVPARPGRRTPTRRSPRSGSPRRCWATATCRSRRCSSAAARRPCCRRPTSSGCSRAVDDEFGLGRRRRGDHRGEPGQRRRRASWRELRDGGFTRISFGMQSAVPHVLAAARPHPRPGAGAAGGAVGPGGRVRAGQPRPHLRHAGGVARRLAAGRSTPRSPASPTTCGRTR